MLFDLRAIALDVRARLADLFREAKPTPFRGLYLQAYDGDGTAPVLVETLPELTRLMREAQWLRDRLAPAERRPEVAAALNALLTQLADARDALATAQGLPLEGPLPPGADPEARGDDAWTPTLE